MKYWELNRVVEYLQKFKRVNQIYRVDYQTIKIEFDRDSHIYFNMKRGGSFIYMRREGDIRPDKINSPFDTLLSHRFNRSKIEKIEIINSDKILRITLSNSNKYKSVTSSIQFEFTGKHTNAILLDEDEDVLEALHHINEYQSVRPVRVGKPLQNPPKPDFQFKLDGNMPNVEEYLQNRYISFLEERLSQTKKREIKKLQSKLANLQKRLKNIESEEKLFEKADEYREIGELILINLYSIPKYGEKIKLINLSGDEVEFNRPSEAKDNNHMANIYFHNSRKMRRKGENSRIERDSLIEKIEFMEKMIDAISTSRSLEEIHILTGGKQEQKRKSRSDDSELFQVFWIEGHKVMLGKSEKGNVQVLEKSRSSDIWIHLKDRPSTHVVVVTDRKEIKESIIREAGKLCAKFSLSESGRYLVDYTERRYVRIQSGSNVLYTNYKTMQVEI